MFSMTKPIIAMIHLKSLPGQPGFAGLDAVYSQARSDINILQKVGFNGLLFENWLEDSCSPLSAPETADAMAKVIFRLKPYVHIPFGINVLNNDYCAAFRIAQKTGASFVQMDVLVDHVRSDFTYSQSGKNHPFEIDVDTHDVTKQRKKYHQSLTPLLTFIQPKHYQLLEKNKSIEQSTRQAVAAGAQAVLVTKATGFAPSIAHIKKAKQAAGEAVWVGIGSGFSCENAESFLPYVDFAVVGTDVKVNRITDNPVDEANARALMNLSKKYQQPVSKSRTKIVSVGDLASKGLAF